MQDHEAAVERALASVSSQIRPDGAVIIRTHRAPEGDLDAAKMIRLARDLPKDEWNAIERVLEDGRPVAIRLEFIYATNRRMAIRVLTVLPRSDGVSATRVALHTLEELEKPSEGSLEEILANKNASSQFKSNPPLVWGLRQRWNNVSRIAHAILAANWPFTPAVSEKEKLVPTSVAGLRHYYSSDPERAAEPAVFKLYRADPDPSLPASSAYKSFVKAIKKWHDQVGLNGYFNLNNFSNKDAPACVCISVVPRAEDLLSVEERYKHMFIPPGPFPFGPIWDVLNCVHVGLLFSNNYGRHDHSFKAEAELFSWDWLGMMGPIPGAGVISINGRTLVWTRWTRQGQEEVAGIFEEVLGPAVIEIEQAPKCLDGSNS